jgi:MFS family permease
MKTRRDAPWLALTLLTAIATVGFIDRIVMNVLAVPVQAEFGISDTQVGLLTGLAFALLNVTLGIAVARYAERGHRLSLIAVGTLLWSLATAACGFVTNFTQLLLARVGVGVGEAVGLPSNQSVLGDYFHPRSAPRP